MYRGSEINILSVYNSIVVNNNTVDVVTFLETVKEKVFDQQLEELVKGIYGM